MKAISWIILGIVIIVGGYFAYQQISSTAIQGDTELGVFTGALPCSGCKEIKTTLTLYGDAKTLNPTMYTLQQEYVGTQKAPAVKKGKWAIQKGFPQNPDATVYALNSDQEKTRQLYAWKVNENELKLLNQQQGKITTPLKYSLTREQ